MITLGIVAVGVVRESRKLSAMAPICRAHCAVIFVIAQLSCLLLCTCSCFVKQSLRLSPSKRFDAVVWATGGGESGLQKFLLQ